MFLLAPVNSNNNNTLFNRHFLTKHEFILHISCIIIFTFICVLQHFFKSIHIDHPLTTHYNFTQHTPIRYLTLMNNNDTHNRTKKPLDINTTELITNTQKFLLVQLLKSKTFIGNWTALEHSTTIGNTHTGRTHIRFNAISDMIHNEEAFVLYFKCYEGNYIDNWISVTSFTNLNHLIGNSSLITTYNNASTYISFNSSFITAYEKGELFTRTFLSSSHCQSQVSLSFPSSQVTVNMKHNSNLNISKNFTVHTIDPSYINISFHSECGFNFSMQAVLDETSSNETIYKVNTYTFINIFSCSLSIIASILMSYQLSKRESNITAITLFTICQTFIWHSCCCLSNIILGLNYPMFILRFTLIGFGYMICFSIFDLKLLYTYWQILLRQIPYDMFMKIKFRFYLIFYALFFCSFFIPIKAFYDKVFISVNFLPLWLPQIVFNAVKNNTIGLPLMYVLINTLERTVLTIYFRGYNENLFRIKSDLHFISVWIIYFVINVVLMYLQVFLGGRFFLPRKIRGIERYEFYKSKEEVLSFQRNVKEMDCVICLQRIIGDNENINENEWNDKKEKEKEMLLKKDDSNNNLNNSNISNVEQSLHSFPQSNTNIALTIMPSTSNENDFVYTTTYTTNTTTLNNKFNISFTWNKTKHICIQLRSLCFTFYKLPKNKLNKPYMITPCGHIFHTECLEKWFNCKRECPNCRTEMKDY